MKSVVACGHPAVLQAARLVLEAGGNAYDAVVAAGFASAVAEPALTSLGGGGFLLARTAEGRGLVFDFFVDTPGVGSPPHAEPHFVPVTVRFPASEQVFQCGLGSAAVPGNLRGFLHVHSRLGRMPLAEVIAPAVHLARDGVALNDLQAYVLGLLRPIMMLTAAGRAIYAPQGSYVEAGDTLRNTALAEFLEAVPDGIERELYEGSLAAMVARDMAEGRGLITPADLAGYRVVERRPLEVRYRRATVLTNPPPAFGGALLAFSLRLLAEAGPAAGTADHARAVRLVAVMQETDRRRDEAWRAAGELTQSDLASSLDKVRTACRGTTHVSVCDREGNVASMTTSNGEGSGYFVPGTGIMLNNMLGEDDLHPDGFHAGPPGERISSMMAPSIVLDGDQVRLAVGSGGSKRIRTALLQVVTNAIDHGMTLEQAVNAPRLHWDGERVQVEPGFGEPVLEELAKRWPVNRWQQRNIYFGGAHAASPQGEGAGDPRRGGSACVIA